MQLAMWSGPRNLSTAMMYSFAARSDFSVIDEPFYAAYLKKTGLEHPMRDAILLSQPNDPNVVIEDLLTPALQSTPHVYQKHMAQHMISDIPRDWIPSVTNVFLIRHPARVVASFSAKYDDPTVSDLGFQQQLDIFDLVQGVNQKAVVIDSTDIRKNPDQMLRRLCRELNLPWDSKMLSWSEGGHASDGVWASHWYGSVHTSTGFAAAERDLPVLTPLQQRLADAGQSAYDRLKALSL